MRLVMILWSIFAIIEMTRCWSSFDHVLPKNDFYYWASPFRTRPVIISVFGHLCRKTVCRGRKGTGVYYRETMSEMVSYHFFLHCPFLEYFVYLASAPRNSEGVANQEGFLRCSKRFDHRSHFISFLLFEFKSIDDVGARKLREMLMLHTNPDLPRTQTSLLRAQSKAGRRLRASLAVCTLPMVSYGSSPPCEKRSAWGGGWAQTPFTVGSRLLEMTVGVSFGASGSFCEHVPNLITF